MPWERHPSSQDLAQASIQTLQFQMAPGHSKLSSGATPSVTEDVLYSIRSNLLGGRDVPCKCTNNKSFKLIHTPYVFRPSADVLLRYGVSAETIGMLEDEEHPLAREYFIVVPQHQRFYLWDKTQREKLVTTIVRGFPMPNVIISKGKHRGEYGVEDGQQRLTTIFLYMLNCFPVMVGDHKVYYDAVPSKKSEKCFVLEQLGLKSFFDDYEMQVQDIAGAGPDEISEIFERLNSGRPLSDGDRYWNRMKDSKLVAMACQLAQEECKNELTEFLDISWDSICKHKTRNVLRDLVGLAAGLASPYSGSDASWADAISRSYRVVMTMVGDESALSHKHDVSKRLRLLLGTFRKAYDAQHPCKNTGPKNRAFSRWLGVMLYDLREREHESAAGITDAVITAYVDYWVPILREFNTETIHLDDPAHPSNIMYLKTENGVPVDSPRANSSGQLLRQRLQLVREVYPTH